ncbi:MAG: hypothetical protein JST00_47565 [Deltaproteobacteria bacterium]|nr:hypothetical protein [Deltaproteobacteria bacterium]
MTSRLFRAVVGIGISLGATSAACLGKLTDDDPPPGALTPPLGTAPPPTSSAPAPTSTGAVEPPDAAPHLPHDAGIDAFCDAAWPTTKGTPIPTCGPIDDCADAGLRPSCYEVVAPGSCRRPDGRLQPVWCVSGTWQCGPGKIPSSDCKCFEGDACN